MRRSSMVWIIIVIVVAVVGIYVWVSMAQQNSNSQVGPYSSGTPSSTTYGQSPTGAGSNAPLILNTMSSGTLGTFLVATNGKTLYRFTKDKPGVSNCTGACAALWPPYTVSATDASSLAAGLGIGGQLATIARADGTMQLTYNGTPLYYYSKDQNSGDTTGQNVMGLWFVVAP